MSNRKTMGSVTDGAIIFNVSVSIDPRMLRDWSSENVAALFEGLSRLIAIEKLGQLEADRDRLDATIRKVEGAMIMAERRETKLKLAAARKKSVTEPSA